MKAGGAAPLGVAYSTLAPGVLRRRHPRLEGPGGHHVEISAGGATLPGFARSGLVKAVLTTTVALAAISIVLMPRFASCSEQTQTAPASHAAPTASSTVLTPLSPAPCRLTLYVEGKHHRGAASSLPTNVACVNAHARMGGMNTTIQKMRTRDAWCEETELRVTGTAVALYSTELWAWRRRSLIHRGGFVSHVQEGLAPGLGNVHALLVTYRKGSARTGERAHYARGVRCVSGAGGDVSHGAGRVAPGLWDVQRDT